MLRSRLVIWLSLALAAMAVLVVCVAVISFVRRGSDRAWDRETRPPRFRIAWEHDAGTPARLWLSPRGTAFCILTRSGLLSTYRSDGRKLYTVHVPDATAAVVTDDGRFALAYAERDPSRHIVRFLDSTGRECWRLDVVGAVWCADGCSNGEAATFVIGTGERYVYVAELGRRKRFRRWIAPGAVTSTAIDPNTQQVTFATWQQSAVCRATPRGRRLWRIDAEPASISRVEVLGSSGRALVRSMPGRPGLEGQFLLIDDAGNEIYRGTIDSPDLTRVLAAPNGRFLCLGQPRLIKHKGRSALEKHTVLLDSTGKTLADKGSLFFEADPLLVTPEGAVLVAGNGNKLFVMTPSGKLEVVSKIPSRVNRCIGSRDGRRALLECEGGKLLMLTSVP
ncbi:MAG: hypothetical protein ACP5R5_07380 [Armatimonadota bacterium]